MHCFMESACRLPCYHVIVNTATRSSSQGSRISYILRTLEEGLLKIFVYSELSGDIHSSMKLITVLFALWFDLSYLQVILHTTVPQAFLPATLLTIIIQSTTPVQASYYHLKLYAP